MKLQICLIFALIGCTLAMYGAEDKQIHREFAAAVEAVPEAPKVPKRPEDFDKIINKVKNIPDAKPIGVRKIEAIGRFLNAYKNDLFDLYINKTKINLIKFHPRAIEKIELALSELRRDLPPLHRAVKHVLETSGEEEFKSVDDLESHVTPDVKTLMKAVYIHLVDLNIYGVGYRTTIPTAIRLYRRLDQKLFKKVAGAFDIVL